MSGSRIASNGIGVCIVVENETVPYDRRVWMEACALRDAGYSVSVISPKRGKWQKSRETIERIEVYRYWCWSATGVAGHVVEYGWSLLAQFVLALRVYARRRFRVIHACNPPELVFLIGRFFKLLGVKFVFDHHDLSPELYLAKFGAEGRKSFLYRVVCAAERLTFATADFSIATNESYREIAISRGGMKAERVAVVQTCASLEEKYGPGPRKSRGQDGNRVAVVTYVGTIGPQDGVDLLLESARYLLQDRRREDLRFVVVGSGTELPKLQKRAAELSFNGQVEFTGRVERQEVDAYLQSSDICVAPDPVNSFTDKCSMIKIFEYMAHGKPTVLFDLREGRRAAGDSALYATGNDPREFAEQIARLVDSEALRQKLGEAGRKRVEGTFNWETQSKRLREAYEKVLAE